MQVPDTWVLEKLIKGFASDATAKCNVRPIGLRLQGDSEGMDATVLVDWL